MTLVFAPGCFDLLHAGHVRMLTQARALCSRLMVGLNTDESISRLKGPTRPIIPYQQRYECLVALRCVDEVIPIVDDTPCNLLRILRPEIVVKGPGNIRDRMPEFPVVSSYGGSIVIMDGPDVSTTQILQRLANAFLNRPIDGKH